MIAFAVAFVLRRSRSDHLDGLACENPPALPKDKLLQEYQALARS